MSKNVNLLTKKQFEIHAKKDHLRLYHTDLVNVFKSPNRLIEQWVDQTTNRD